MEWKIGEIFEVEDQWYQCVQGNCEVCDFSRDEHTCLLGVSNCVKCRKNNDCKAVAFKKFEKVGEPFTGKVHIQLQRYKIYTEPIIDPTENVGYINEENTIAIEIKQNKEDMEEKDLVEKLSEKVHNAWMKKKEAQGFSYGKEYDKEKKKHPDMLPYNELKEEVKEYDRVTVKAVLQAQKELSADANKLSFKEFNLEAAKLGKPVCTRDGRKARIICFDRRLFYKNVSYPILALVERSDGEDDVCGYNEKGKVLIEDGAEYKDDLMMLPEKRSGWAKVRKDINLYDTKEEVDRKMIGNDEYVTAKVCWEE